MVEYINVVITVIGLFAAIARIFTRRKPEKKAQADNDRLCSMHDIIPI